MFKPPFLFTVAPVVNSQVPLGTPDARQRLRRRAGPGVERPAGKMGMIDMQHAMIHIELIVVSNL